MLIYGTKGKIIKNGSIRNVSCSSCHNETTLNYAVIGKYVHLYWIPFFPYKKTNVVECTNCGETFMIKDLSQKVQDKFSREKENTGGAKLPIWMFSGLIIIIGLISLGVYSSNRTHENEIGYINSPKAGDIYSYSIDSTSHYSTMRVDNVTKDSVHLTQNDYETDKMKGIYEINTAKNYTSNKITISKADLKNLYDKNTIYSIDR